MLKRRFGSDRAQTTSEYGVVLALITLTAVGALTALSTHIRGEVLRIAGYIFS